MDNTHKETDILLVLWTEDEVMGFLGNEARASCDLGTWRLRLNDASIVTIKNGNIV